MKKQLLVLSLLILGSIVLQAQQATNFSCNDCAGKPYDLFTELDSGKVIVMCWVMPCGSCILPATTAYNVAMSYATTHPGRVVMYVIDDYANTSCNDINNWCYVYGLDTTVRFVNTSIKMTDYGSVGMPKTIVVGGAWRKVYFNQNNGVNALLLKDAIDLALLETNVQKISGTLNFDLKVTPNPVYGHGVLSLNLAEEDYCIINIFNTSGQKVKLLHEGLLPSGKYENQFNFSLLPAGIYYVQVITSGWQETIKIVTAER